MNSIKIDGEMISNIIEPLTTSHADDTDKRDLIPTGIDSVDTRLLHGGLRRGHAYFVRSADWIGKMSFALNITAAQIIDKSDPIKIVFVPGVHDLSSTLTRLICILANVPSAGTHRVYSAERIQQIRQAAGISNANMEIISPSSPEDMRLQCFRSQPDLIVVDRPLAGKGQFQAHYFSIIAKESHAVVLVLETLSNKAVCKLRKHRKPEEVIKTADKANNIDGIGQFILHRDSFYEIPREDQEFYDFFILYCDGLNPTAAVHCLRSRESEKIISLPDDQKGGIK